MNNEQLQKIALEMRRIIITACYTAGAGHITSAFSCVEILTALYFGKVMRYQVSEPLWEERDYLVLSKGHAGIAQYSALAEAGFIPKEELKTFCAVGTRLGCHPTTKIPGIESASGSLGHGLSFSVGLALSAKLKKTEQRVYCITGDGELQEGNNWEAAMSVAHFKLNNLIWIIDKNELQIAGTTDEVMSLGDLRKKIEDFGFGVVEVNGHDFNELISVLKQQVNLKPLAIIAHTIKGYGAPSISGKREWHNRKPTENEAAIILSELGMHTEDLQY
jgi:transketolase